MTENFITVPVFERDPITGQQKRNLGMFQFLQLPAPATASPFRVMGGLTAKSRVPPPVTACGT